MVNVAVLDDYQGVAEDYGDWGGLDAEVEIFGDHLTDQAELVARLERFEVIVAMRERTPFPRSLLQQLPNLRLLVTTGTRNASIDVEAAAELGIVVSGTPNPGHGTAELAFMLVQMLARGVLAEIDGVRAGRWQVGVGGELAGRTLGLLGVGRLGSRMARYGNAFDMDVIAWSQNLTAEQAAEAGARAVSKAELLAASDFLSIHVRLSERTTGLIGAGDLRSMKPTAFLVNTSRGPIVDEDALLEAVRSGEIAGAGLDVFSTEPLPLDHPFRNEPGIIVTPHIGYVTDQVYSTYFPGTIEVIEAWMSGTPIRTL